MTMLKDVKTQGEGVNEIHCTANGNEHKLISNDMITQMNESVEFIRLLGEKSVSLNKDLNVDIKDLSCANRMKRTHDKDHVLKVNYTNVYAHEEYIPANNGVHVGFVSAIEDIIEDTDPCIHKLKKKDSKRNFNN